MKKLMPKRALNRALVIVGIFGLVFQFTAAIFIWWRGDSLHATWFMLLIAPALCVLSGALPPLQLQKEPD